MPDQYNDNYTIIPHTNQPHVLLLHTDDGWTLPQHSATMPVEINAAMKEQLGLTTTVLYCAYDRYQEDERQDQHTNNILYNGGAYVFIDLAECILAHPFCSMFIALRVAKYSLEYDAEMLERLRQAYLAPWAPYEPMQRLQRTFVLAQRLGSLYKALSDTRSFRNLSRACSGCLKMHRCITCGCFWGRRSK